MNYQGWKKTPPNELMWFEKLLGQTQGSPLFSDLYQGDSDAGKGKLSLPYKSVLKFCPEAFGDEKQVTGDCVSHGTRNGCDIPRAVDIDIKGEPEEWVARGATEHIYGMRGHTGQGMNTARACRFVHEKGFLARAKYGSYDLSRYNAQLGIAWGRTGTPKALQEEAAKQPMRYFAQVSRDRAKAAVEIRSALANGYAVVIGGVGGWSSKRNEKGISQPGGSWNHCMCIGGYDDTCDLDNEPLALVLQSWGKWNSGGHPPWGQIPTGSALIPISYIIDRYVMGGDCIVIGNAQGYPARDLPDYGFDYV